MGRGTAFLLGGALGAAVALMFAPDKGSVTRQKVQDGLDDAAFVARDYATNCPVPGVYAGSVNDRVREASERGAQVMQDASKKVVQGINFVYDNASDRIKAAKAQAPAGAVVPETDELREKIDAARERIAAQVTKNAEDSTSAQ